MHGQLVVTCGNDFPRGLRGLFRGISIVAYRGPLDYRGSRWVSRRRLSTCISMRDSTVACINRFDSWSSSACQ